VDRPGIGKKSEKNDVSGELKKTAWGGVKTVEIVKTQKMAENVKKTRIAHTHPPPPVLGSNSDHLGEGRNLTEPGGGPGEVLVNSTPLPLRSWSSFRASPLRTSEQVRISNPTPDGSEHDARVAGGWSAVRVCRRAD
jgi:hypothetical protein